MIAPIIPPTIIQPAEHLPTLVGNSCPLHLPTTLVTVETTNFVAMSAWVVEDIVGEAVDVVNMSAEGQKSLLSSVMIIIMVNNSHIVL